MKLVRTYDRKNHDVAHIGTAYCDSSAFKRAEFDQRTVGIKSKNNCATSYINVDNVTIPDRVPG